MMPAARARFAGRNPPRRERHEEAPDATPVSVRVVGEILRAVEEHRLPPGSKLTEETLAEVFDTTRAQVRHALQHLALKHIVTLRPNRGAFVAEPSVTDARAVFAARRLIEPPLAGTLVGRLGAPQLARLRRAVAAEDAARNTQDRHAGIKLSGEFHVALAELSGNVVVTDILRELVARSSLIIAIYKRAVTVDCGPDEHRELVEALASGPRRQVERLMDHHLRHVEAGLTLAQPRGEGVDLREVFAMAPP
jgi:DNA-binding GntR family transcriptional regulator